ncbi:MAG: DEAD/DEAH box helicase [Azospirillaceae bacterium]
MTTTFADLELSANVLRAVEDVGYKTPTPIQQQAIPIVLQGRDVLGIAQTGTGKTAGFTLPMIDILSSGRAKARMPRSLILEPTRELATQVSENFELYGKYQKLNYALLIGGERFEEQSRLLDRGVDVLIATPGRMLDLFERGKILLADVKILVIDEADRMLDMGFIPDIERIVGLLPRIRQTLFFSATMPKEIRRLADAFLSNPKEIAVSPPSTTAENVQQFIARVSKDDKREALRRLLQSEEGLRNALVFCNRKRDIDAVYRALVKSGFNAGQLHGDMPQPTRTATLEKFKAGDIDLLVCSDVAARGIDISGLSHVFNYDVPMNAEDYVHRIGRTGRAGKTGRAFMIATPDDGKYVDAIIKLVKRAPETIAVEGLGEVAEDDGAGRRRRGGKRSEPSANGAVRERQAEPERQAGPERQAEPEPAAEGEADPPPRRETAGGRPAERSRDEAGRRGDRRRGRGRGRDQEDAHIPGDVMDERDDVPFAKADHVPAFLLRQVSIPKPSRNSKEAG